MDDDVITPTEVCELARVVASTLRAWHNRLGFLPRDDAGKWRRYSLSELIAVRVMVVLTERGLVAAEAVQIVHRMMPEIEQASRGGGNRVAVSWESVGQTWDIEPIDVRFPFSVIYAPAEVTLMLNLGYVASSMFFAFRTLRGLSTKLILDAQVKDGDQ